jgi:hypothetical protein
MSNVVTEAQGKAAMRLRAPVNPGYGTTLR